MESVKCFVEWITLQGFNEEEPIIVQCPECGEEFPHDIPVNSLISKMEIKQYKRWSWQKRKIKELLATPNVTAIAYNTPDGVIFNYGRYGSSA